MPDAEGRSAGGRGAGLSGPAALTESPTASAPPAAAPAQASPVERDSEGMPKDTTANRENHQRRIREMVETLEAGGTRKIMSNEDGMLATWSAATRWRCSSCAARSRWNTSTSPRCSSSADISRTNSKGRSRHEHEDERERGPRGDAALATGRVEARAAIARLDAVDPDEQMSNEEASDFIAQFVNPEAVEARRDEFATFILEAEAFADAEAHDGGRDRRAGTADPEGRRAHAGRTTKVMKAAGVKALSGATYTIKLEGLARVGRCRRRKRRSRRSSSARRKTRTCWRSSGSPASS